MRKKHLMTLAVIIGILILDILTKRVVLQNLALGEKILVFSWLDITLVYNKGAAFSFLSSVVWANIFFISFAVIAIFFIGYWLISQTHQLSFLGENALRLVLSGAFGNLLDRIQYGHVIDFISVHYQDWYYPSFNIADSAISVGAVLIIVDVFLSRKQSPPLQK